MQQLQPDQAHLLLNVVYLPGLKNEHHITKSIIEAIPLDKGDYRPDEISRGALDLAWHIVATEMRFMTALPAGEFDFSPRPRPDSIKSSADLTGWYTANFAALFDKLTKLSNEQLLKIVDFRGMFQLPVINVPEFPAESLGPSSGAIVDVSAANGSEGAGDLRRKLRHRGGSQGQAAECLKCPCVRMTASWRAE